MYLRIRKLVIEQFVEFVQFEQFFVWKFIVGIVFVIFV